MFDRMLDWFNDIGFLWIIIGGAVCLIVGCIWYSIKHPCVRESPQETLLYYQQIGKVLMPVYGHACLERR